MVEPIVIMEVLYTENQTENGTFRNDTKTCIPIEVDEIFIICSVLIAVTIVGNIFVILAFCVEPKLKSLTNYWIVSLSVTDIVLAAIVMPIAAIKDACDGYWAFGTVFCDIFIMLDVLCCTCSIYHLCLISLDRFFCVRFPLTYPRRRSVKATLVAIVITWIWCSLLSSLRPLGWKVDSEIFVEDECAMTNKTYMIFSSIISFYLPLCIIICMYTAVYRITRLQMSKFGKQSYDKHLRKQGLSSLVTSEDYRTGRRTTRTSLGASLFHENMSSHSNMSRSRRARSHTLEPDDTCEPLSGGRGSIGRRLSADVASRGRGQHPPTSRSLSALVQRARNSLQHQGLPVLRQPAPQIRASQIESRLQLAFYTLMLIPRSTTTESASTIRSCSISSDWNQELETALSSNAPRRGSEPLRPTPADQVTALNIVGRLVRSRQRQEQRATKIVLVVVGAFMLFWTPFFVVNSLTYVKEPTIWQAVTWLGYANSAINPFIYTYFNRTFRRAIKNLFKCRTQGCRRLQKQSVVRK